MCKIVVREGTASLVVIPALVWKISQENERGLEIAPPPVGRGLTKYLFNTGYPKKMYHICFAHSFHTFLRNLLKHTSKDSQIHGDLLTPRPDSRPWRSRCHVLEVSTVLGHAQRCSASGLLGLVSRYMWRGKFARWQHE